MIFRHRAVEVRPAGAGSHAHLGVAVVATAPLSAFKKPMTLRDRGYGRSVREMTAGIYAAAGKLADVKRLAAWMKAARPALALAVTAHEPDGSAAGFELVNVRLELPGIDWGNLCGGARLGRTDDTIARSIERALRCRRAVYARCALYDYFPASPFDRSPFTPVRAALLVTDDDFSASICRVDCERDQTQTDKR